MDNQDWPALAPDAALMQIPLFSNYKQKIVIIQSPPAISRPSLWLTAPSYRRNRYMIRVRMRLMRMQVPNGK